MGHNLSCPFQNESALKAPVFEADPEALFSHPDKTAKVDALEDPLKEIAVKLQAMGDVAVGYGVGEPLGSEIRFGDVVLPNMFVAARFCTGKVYAAVSWKAARAVYSNHNLFSVSGYSETIGQWGPLINTMDPPEHTKYRRIMQPGFTPEAVAKYESELVRPVIARRFAALKHKGRADLVRELTPYNAYEITGRIAGFNPEDIAYVASCFAKMNSANINPAALAEGSAALRDYAGKLVARLRAAPGDDVISSMIRAEIDGAPVADDNRLVGMIISLLGGGIDTIYKQSNNIICLLLNNPGQFDLIKADRSLIPNFVEESLRYDGVASMMARQATRETELLGVPMPRGAIVFVPQAVANRDPARWDDPHKLDVTREVKPHVQFAAGVHSCAGAGLARVALGVLIEHLIDDLPNLRWDPDQKPARITGWHQRTPLGLPVLWDIV